MIFNKRGLRPKFFPDTKFYINEQLLENAETYTYLGVIFVPSGSPTAASKELYQKASRSWFSLSHVIYQNKKMPVKRALQLVVSAAGPLDRKTARAPQAGRAPLTCIGDAAFDVGLLESSYDEVVQFWGLWSRCILVIWNISYAMDSLFP